MGDALQGLIAQLSTEKRSLLASMLRPEPDPIAVVGIGCRFPGGAHSPDSFWDLLRDGRDGLVEIPADRWELDGFYDPDPGATDKSYVRVGGFLSDISRFDADFFGIAPREALRMDPQQRLLLEVTWEALEDAGQANLNLQATAGHPTGVFVGMTNNQHILRQVMADRDFYRDPFAGIGSDSSAAAGRVAYTFNFQGPTVSLDTACSSSLVALHLACQSLRNKECERAVVGGVYAIMMPQSFIVSCRMGMLSPDGRCKTFDARADGYGLGEGCGIVVLKRLNDALAAGDNVRAIIRGSAVNEDGRSNGLTAPNGLAQQAVIRRALHNANVAPHQVSYVEAHGTGTALGDPIELESLQTVLGADRPAGHPLYIGAVKTNLGHLYPAAGIAGFIKTVLALQHKAIPQHLHFEQPNAAVPWDAQIRVPQRLTPWPAVAERRIAGVSAFGWSGTNAHVIVEETDAPRSDEPRRPYFLMPLSARTPEALEAATAGLQRHLQQNPDASLADVAYTLQTGRRPFAHRRVFACRSRAEALQALSGAPTARRFDGIRPAATSRVIFLFSGVGDHYPGMGRELYETEPLFRERVDACCDFLQPLLGVDLRRHLFPPQAAAAKEHTSVDLRRMAAGARARAANGYPGVDESGLARTEFAQPAVFVIEYALACLLQSWGIRPDAVAGHSLGEYVAACVAGLFSLQDALTLVARRAQLIQSLPPGRMLAVALPAKALRLYLDEEVTLAVHNGAEMCTVAGPPQAIERLRQRLAQKEIACRLLETPHAFHSLMMAPAGAELTALANAVELCAPEIPILSNVSGDWLSDAQALDVTYWTQHMCQPVRFYEGLDRLLDGQEPVLIEIGPGQSLGSFVRQHPRCTPAQMQRTFSTLPTQYEKGSAVASVLECLGRLWAAGVEADWQTLYAEEERRRRIPLPTYPFGGDRFWVGPEMRQFADEVGVVAPRDEKQPDSLTRLPLNNWFYLPGWQQAAVAEPATPLDADGWVLFVDDGPPGRQIADWLRAQGQEALCVRSGASWQQMSAYDVLMRPAQRADYDALAATVQQRGWRRVHLVHLWTVSGGDDLEATLDHGFYSLINLVQALQEHDLERCALTVVTSEAYAVTGAETVRPANATVIGPCRTIPLEYETISCRLVDVRLPQDGSWQAEALLRNLLGELTSGDKAPVVALRRDRRWLPTFTPLALPAPGDSPRLLRHGGAYLITGGLGGLGLAVARYLAQTVQANVALLGRTPLPRRCDWSAHLANGSGESEICRKIREIEALEALGVKVLPLAADVTDEAQMAAAVAQVVDNFGALHGVFHAAGVPGRGVIQLKEREAAARVLAPKVQGTLVLERVLQQAGVAPDFLLLFSSVASFVAGGPGQVDYCAANAFLDAYAHNCAGQARVTAAVNWGEWQWNSWEETLDGFGDSVQAFFKENRARFGITSEEGGEALARVLERPLSQLIVSTQDFPALLRAAQRLTVASLLPSSNGQPGERHIRPSLSAPYVAPRNAREQAIAAAWEAALGVSGIGIDDNFFDLGGNSLIGLGLVRQLQQALNLPQLPDRILYESPSIRALAESLDQGQQQSKALMDRQHARGQKRQQQYMERRRQKLRDE